MPRSSDPIDAHVAQRLKLRRELAGYTQERLGAAVGVSFQMIQKYENAGSRVGASRLLKIAKILEVPVSWFFEGFQGGANTSHLQLAQTSDVLNEDVFSKKETHQLLKAYYALSEPLRQHVLAMVLGLKEIPAEEPVKSDAKPK